MNTPPDVFARHLLQIKNAGWHSITLAEIIRGQVLRPRSFVLSFDDGYQDFAETAWPMIQAHGFTAVNFVVPTCVGRENQWDGGGTSLMSLDTLKDLAADGLEIGLHGWQHEDWDAMPEELIQSLLNQGLDWFQESQLPLTPAFAYPGGKFPRREPHQSTLARVFAASPIQMAFRIGSALARVPCKNPWAMCRVPIEGTDGPLKLRIKMTLGRTRF